ncbi:trehalose-phosphatase [Streptomyces radicis]|uniref:Trehalose 6-phosphate phosphatase n=1 Tax=Streptomyces radicis TaxID=1750517 RepID=A0A3A9W9L2_9ACTN|nr:trehalose-phosphatase [Streptomyces radicis]RKN09828.1 trehalose-phosphatase [Streptomyces radicis]RKN23464.1 trehalose-phosphatase [Streptomyces radicis]
MGSLPVPTTDAGRAGLSALLDQPERALIALDFDGTLAPIVPDPEQARPHPAAVPALARVAGRVAVVAIVTGRPAEVAVRLGGFEGHPELAGLVVLGAYGAERWDAATGELSTPPPHEGVIAARAELPGLVAESGAFVEDKGNALAVHTRRAPDPAGAFAALREPLAALAARHGLAVEPGRLVIELRPPGSDKGAALKALARETDARAVLYGGDDLGDLAAFAAVAALRERGVAGLRVCSGSAEVAELAAATDVTVEGPEGIADLLTALAERFG